MPSPYLKSPDQNNLKSLGTVFLILYLIIAIGLTFWGIIRAESILLRPDNPRLVEREQRIQRGAILDRNNNILAYNEGDDDQQQRTYTYPNFGPAVGYYSVNLGTSGAESGFDGLLRNDPTSDWQRFWQETLHTNQIGNNVKLALDSQLQEASINALDNRNGAALVLEIDPAAPEYIWIRSLANSPTYDSNSLDEQFDELSSNSAAPLLNRAMQGQYQPGLLLQPFIIGYAIDRGLINLNDSVQNAEQVINLNGQQIGCQKQPPLNATWVDVIRYQCPGPMVNLADQIGLAGLDSAFAQFGFTQDPDLEIETATILDEPTQDPLMAGIGQENLSITPYQLGLALTALANNGMMAQGQLGLEFQDNDGTWQPWRIESEPTFALSPSTAAAIKESFPGGESLFEQSHSVLSGPESNNAWYHAIIDQQGKHYILVVVLEGEENRGLAEDVGHALVSALNRLQ